MYVFYVHTFNNLNLLRLCPRPPSIDAKNVWNNLLEPSGAKSSWNRFASLKCPTNDRPYLFTQKNSNLDDFDNNDEGDDVEDDGRRPFQRKVLVRRRRLRTRSASHPPPIWSRNQYQCNLL